MTTPSARATLTRRGMLTAAPAVSLAALFASACRERASELGAYSREFRWPSPKWRKDPVGFFRTILGVEPWKRQIEIIEAVRDHDRVSIRSGHKVSKSNTFAGLALWFYSSYEDARVVMTSTTSRQVDQILWRELKMMHARCGRCVSCKRADEEKIERDQSPGPVPCPHSHSIPETPYELARSGLKSRDFREVVGFTAKEAEAVAGVSGSNLLYLVDEASGVPDVVFQAIEGNRAGGARIVMASNPTRTDGEFYESFHSKKNFYHCIHISSEESPNVIAGQKIIPGLCERWWIEEKREEWGESNPLYLIRVKGEFAVSEDGKILTIHALTESENRWPDTPAEGRVFLGVDPAGPGLAGDESGFALRRGLKIKRLRGERGLTEEAHLTIALQMLNEEHQERDEVPCVVVDREGPIGARVWGIFSTYADQHPRELEVYGLRSTDRACRQSQLYHLMRDEMWANLAAWVSGGGAIYPDARLQKDLHAGSWISRIDGKLKVTPKEEIRKSLGRSPDRGDAVALSCWVPAAAEKERSSNRAPSQQREERLSERQGMSPYKALDTWRDRGDR